MNKCVSCEAELPPQTRFCGICGATQPSGTHVGAADNIETVLSNPHGEKPPVNTPPSPPQPPQNTGDIQKRNVGISPSGQQEYKPPTNSSAGQLNNPPSAPHQQSQTSYDEAQHFPLQQPHSSYQQPQPPYGDYQQQPSSPYNYQQSPPPSPYGNYQQPYGNYQQPPQPQQSYVNYQSAPLYGDYQPPSQPYGNYQQPPVLQPSGIHVTDTVDNINPNIQGIAPIPTGTPPKAPAWRKWVIIAVVVVVILAGSGILAVRLLTPPLMPTINVASNYHDNGMPAGADGTTLQITGKQFVANSPLTFLLDSTAVKQDMQAESDASGNVTATLTVAPNWPLGQHKLTAHDANNNTTNTSTAISIVHPGEAHTPGPNGAPPNDATFKINMEFHMQDTSFTSKYELDINYQGKPVCAPGDDGSPQKSQGSTTNGMAYTETSSYTCNGTYQAGVVVYDDTLNTDIYVDANGGTCSLNRSQPSYIHIKGNYTTSQQFSGDITVNSIAGNQYTCTGDLTFNTTRGSSGTWTGTVSNLGTNS
jgi:hypothetical protein